MTTAPISAPGAPGTTGATGTPGASGIPGTPLVELSGITRSFTQGDLTVDVLRGVSFSIAHGEFVAIQGSSGSGKSTLLHILGLLDSPTAGRYVLDGHDVSHLDDDARSEARNQLTGFVFQNFYLIPYATALDNVLLPGLYSHKNLRVQRKRAEELLHRVGLGDRMDFVPARLSGGQQQRVALARALLNDPALILADEPTGQLDSTTSADILDLFADINRTGKTVVVVTHDAETAARARRRIVIRDGVIESDGLHGSAAAGGASA
ncbi:MAG TPA: ABC transporter ATP-binding protein [Nitratidesulfovibrio sp.]|nr:ABC transporter ATP-binding protein [Nitratidesulfovibrio sp.]